MSFSENISFILLAVIGLIILIDFKLKSRKKSLETSVEIFVEKDSIVKKIIKKVAVIIATLAILFLGYNIIKAYPSLIYNYDELDIKIKNKKSLFDLSSNDFGKLIFEINKPYKKAELRISIEGNKTGYFFDYNGNGFDTIDIFKQISKRTKDKIVTKLISGDEIDINITFRVIGGIIDNEVLAEHNQFYSLTPNTDASFNLPKIIDVNGINFTRQYSVIKKDKLISKILDNNFVTTGNLKEPKIISADSKLKISVKLDKIYENSFLTLHTAKEEYLPDWKGDFSEEVGQLNMYKLDQYASKTNIRRNTDNTYTLSREFTFNEEKVNERALYSHLILHNYDQDGIDHRVLIGSFILDNKAPEVYGFMTVCGYNFEKNEISGCVCVSSENWVGNRKPFKVKVKGDISKIYINGFNISFDKEKAKKEELDLYKTLYFDTDLGHYRWPIKVVDLRGNVFETYIEGECVPLDQI
jgi:hypothetical protein